MHLPYAGHRRLLGKYLAPQRERVLLLAGLLLAGIAPQLLNPQIVRYFIDTAQAGGPLDRLLLAGLIFLVAGLSARALGLAAAYAGFQVAWTATNALRADLLGHVLRLDMPFHKLHTPGELIERVDGDPGTLGQFFSGTVIKTIANGLLVVGILFFLYREDVRAGLALTVYALVAVLALAALQRSGARRFAAARQAWADQSGFIEERLSGAEDIRGVGAENYTVQGLTALTQNVLLRERAARMAQALGSSVVELLYVVAYGIGLAIGALLYSQNQISIGTAFIIVYYIGMLWSPLHALREEAGNLQQATASVQRVEELLSLPAPASAGGGTLLPGGALAVSVTDVSFTYHDQPVDGASGGPALRHVSFTLAPGRVLGVLGRTGSGKSTLTRLLYRFYEPDAGALTVGGVPLSSVEADDLRRRTGMVTQDVQLFGASLRDNIALFDPNVTDDTLWRALDELGLRDWVSAMPGGLDSELAPGGANLSAGEAQLVAFARLLLRDPGLIILDEAASRLDPNTERRLARAIDRLLVGRTAIVIAHRIHTLQQADDILILDGGQVVEFGTRAALAADPKSRYSRLQRLGFEEALA